MTKTWEFKEYDVFLEGESLTFELSDGTLIGEITNVFEDDEIDLIKELENGADPIADGWEDGIGNTLQIWGWGDHYPQNMEEVFDRINTLYSIPQNKWVELFKTQEDVISTYDEMEFVDANEAFEAFAGRYGKEIDELEFPIITYDDSTISNGYVTDNIYDAITEAESFLGEKAFTKTISHNDLEL